MKALEAYRTAVGLRVRNARVAFEISQSELACRAKIHRVSINYIERGHMMPMVWTLVRIAAALEVSPGSLLPEYPLPRDT